MPKGADLFRKLKYPHSGIHFTHFTDGESIGIDPCTVRAFQGVQDGRKVLK